MGTRKILRNDLIAAWSKTISERYHSQQIDSERALQAHFCAALLLQFSENNRTRRLFIEPTIKFSDDNVVKKPDLLICNQNSIIGIVELKYKPRGRAGYNKDLETLQTMKSNHANIVVRNGRYLGPRKPGKPYTLAHDAVLCWAAIYTGKQIVKPDFLEAEARPDFLALHAITSERSNPLLIPTVAVVNDA